MDVLEVLDRLIRLRLLRFPYCWLPADGRGGEFRLVFLSDGRLVNRYD